MEWNEVLMKIFELCIIPLLSTISIYIVNLIKKRVDALTKESNNVLANKYLEGLETTIINCVKATNQTYVNTLKEQGSFNKAAQEEAFKRTYEAVMAIVTDDAQKYLKEITNDVPTLVTNLIEAKISETKK